MIHPCCGCRATGRSGAEVRRIPVAIPALLLLALAACGGRDDEAGADAGGSTSGTTGSVRGAEPVSAVLQSTGTPLASLRFTLPERPVAGQPFTMELSATASQPVEALQVQVESAQLQVDPATAGLMLEGGDRATTLALTLTAQQPGLAEISVRLTGEGSPTPTAYAIPVLVSAPAGAGED